ncbi:ABC transporter ATP-binding protein [Actinomyces culturomici]|uniref:ABC transporter ATP-binding protein n=1 Tax=Actinomyces culturomici TaxID=1926276 RepID=UPI000E1FF039|nr:ABC transporter ATP-binding protein [Actinomyces culturomici]
MSIPAPAAVPSDPVVRLESVSKIYGEGETRVAALDSVSCDFTAGAFTAIMGPSGSGKSTMLHVLAGLDTPTDGEVRIEGTRLSTLDDDSLTRLRRDRIGFVFQAFNLVPTLDARANIELPLRLAGREPDRRWLSTIVDALGLGSRLTHLPRELSGGQQQRVAIARALASKPAVIVADEPTGNLDSAASAEVLELLREAVDRLGQSVVMVTHDADAALIADRVLVVRDGRIHADLASPTAAALAEVAR